MLKKYYSKELNLLKNTSKSFSSSNPGLASFLRKASDDPDTERLLEGFAFLSANIHKELDELYPEFIYALMQMVCPNYLLGIPSITMMKFLPKVNLLQKLPLCKNTYVDSEVPDKSGTDKKDNLNAYRFSTCYEIEVLPLEIQSISYIDDARKDSYGSLLIKMDIHSPNINVSELDFNKLRFYLGDQIDDGYNLYFWLNTMLQDIVILANGKEISKVNLDSLQSSFFKEPQNIIDSKKVEFPAFRMLQEYFILPNSYLFVDVNLENCIESINGTEFSLIFRGKRPDFVMPELSESSFMLNVVPAINLFMQTAEPERLTIDKSQIRISARNVDGIELPIHSINKLITISNDASEPKELSKIDHYNRLDDSIDKYMNSYKPDIEEDDLGLYIDIISTLDNLGKEDKILKPEVFCFNKRVSETVNIGDVRVPTINTPELVSFTNISSPTKEVLALSDSDNIWSLISDLSISFSNLSDVNVFKSLLKHYIPRNDNDETRHILNSRKVDSIIAIKFSIAETVYKQSIVKGHNILLAVNSDVFSCPGDLYLFGSVLDYFFANMTYMNVFTELTIEDCVSGESLQWPIRIGCKPLI